MDDRAHAQSSAEGPRTGVGVDAYGFPVKDPTANVLESLRTAIQRQDDLREAADRHVREIAELRAEYDEKLRKAETARIDAIRAVDVGAVNRAAEVSAQVATTLAAQVATSAETLRTQVAAAATATAQNLVTALAPMQKAIDDLRQAQFITAGQKTQVVESQVDRRGNTMTIVAIVSAALAFVAIVVAVVIAVNR
ncbi:MAG TPA: hypothetical protein VGP91_04320 [Actinoplanes sp.]|nr:hypothetical protein [Actinoplanes sp.]